MKTLLNMLLALAVTPAISQNNLDYIIGKHDDTLQVHFYVPPLNGIPLGDSVWLSEKVVIIEDSRIIEFLPRDLGGFSYNGAYYESVCWVADAGASPPGITYRFCKRIVSGVIPVFSCHSVTTHENGDKHLTTDLYYKEDENYKKISLETFGRAASELLSRYPQLAEKVRKENLNRQDFLAIVKSYNKFFEPKTSH